MSATAGTCADSAPCTTDGRAPASASADKLRANQELSDLIEALGCGTGDTFIEDDLRYEKIIIMTDADVDGAHISSLLMTFFYKEIPELIKLNHLYIAIPPLYRITQGTKTLYARGDREHEHFHRSWRSLASDDRGDLQGSRISRGPSPRSLLAPTK